MIGLHYLFAIYLSFSLLVGHYEKKEIKKKMLMTLTKCWGKKGLSIYSEGVRMNAGAKSKKK